MNQKQLTIVFIAFFLHIFLIMYLPLVTTLGNIEKFGDFSIFTNMIQEVQINPLLMYTTSFWFLPAWYYVFYLLTPLGIWGFLWVQSLFMCPTLYIFGSIVAKKTNNLLTFLVLMLAFSLGWYYTFNYRAGNAKTIMLFFLVLAYWAIKEQKHPIIAAIGLTMAISMIPYLAFILVYYILQDFNWKKLIYTAVVFVALNSMFIIVPGLLWSYIQNAGEQYILNPTFIPNSYEGSWGIFTYLRFVMPSASSLILIIGIACFFGSALWLWVKKYPASDFVLYCCLLAIMFYGRVEWGHSTSLLPPLLIFYVEKYPLRLKDDRGNFLSEKIILEWLPFLCFLALCLPTPSSFLSFLPDVIQPWERLTFYLTFFILTIKHGLLWPMYHEKLPNEITEITIDSQESKT